MKIALVGVFGCVGIMLGQTPVLFSGRQLASVTNLPLHKIAPNDLLGLSVNDAAHVYDAPQLTRNIRADPGGMIEISALSQAVPFDCQLPKKLVPSISNLLKQSRFWCGLR